MACTSVTDLRPRALRENDIRLLAGRLEARGAALVRGAPTLAADLTAGAGIIHGLVDALNTAVAPHVAERLVAQIQVREA